MSKLLIVDDSPALLQALKYILEGNDYIVKTLNNVDDIYNEIHDFQPDLLMLDIFLDGEDKREICKELRAAVENKDLRIIVLSSFPKQIEDYKNYCIDDFLEKPFELKSLMEKIKSLLCLQAASYNSSDAEEKNFYIASKLEMNIKSNCH